MSLPPPRPCSPQSDQPADVCRFRWSHLYSDALHSILQFAALDELSRVLSVCRRWNEAVVTMPPIQDEHNLGGAIDCFNRPEDLDGRALLVARMRGPLARHVVSFGSYSTIRSIADLQLVAESMSWLRELRICSEMEPTSPELWPAAIAQFASLRCLWVDLIESGWGTAATNKLLAAIGTRDTLEILSIELPASFGSEVSFAPLSALRSLRKFTVYAQDAPDNRLSDAQIAELRAMTSVHTFSSSWISREEPEKCAFLTRMLQPGHALQWTSFSSWIELREPLASLIGSLSALTELEAALHCPNVGCFSQLLQLTAVSLYGGLPTELDVLVASLSHCSKLQLLTLKAFDLTTDHLAQLLPCFPQLSALTLDDFPAVVSLRFLATPALARSLCSVYLWQLPACPSAELVHLLELRALADLSIDALATPLGDEQRAYSALPSARFPKLASVYLFEQVEDSAEIGPPAD